MNAPPDAVSREFLADRVSAAHDSRLHGFADLVDRCAGAGHTQRLVQPRTPGGHQAVRRRPDSPDRYRDTRVGIEPIQLRGHVQLDEIAKAKSTPAGDAVNGLVVDADAIHAGKAVIKLRA